MRLTLTAEDASKLHKKPQQTGTGTVQLGYSMGGVEVCAYNTNRKSG